MAKFFLRSFLVVIIIIIFLLTFLTFFGLETNKFDHLIKNKTNEINNKIKLEFSKTKIHLKPSELNIIVRLQDPKILVRNNEIDLSKLSLFLSIKSFFSSDFLLKRAEIAFIKNDIKDITKITNIFFPKIINKRLKKIFAEGSLDGEFIVPFEPNGSIGEDYRFSGRISDALINFTKRFSIKNLTTEIKHSRKDKKNKFMLTVKKGSLFDMELDGSTINLLKKRNETSIESILHTNGRLNFDETKKILSLFNLSTDFLKDAKSNSNLITNINFDINNKFKIRNLYYSIEGKISDMELITKEKKAITKYLTSYDSKIILKDTNIKLIKLKSGQITELDGLIKINKQYDNFKIKNEYDKFKKSFDILGSFDLTNSIINLSKINFKKDKKIKSELNFDINFIINKYFYIKELNFISGKNKIFLSKIRLNKHFELEDISQLQIKTFQKGLKNNDFLLKKTDKIKISGEIFDAQPLLKSLYKKDDKNTFSKKFNSNIKVNIDKTITGTNDNVSSLALIATIKNGSFDKLSLKGDFSKNEIIEMSIYQIDKDKKSLQVISDRARPFVKHFDFIEGFEGGKLEYESIISKKVSSSNLIITDFKVSKVPALAQLLTLASLQGIADTLSGEGIRFEAFEMKSKSEGNALIIEESLALGPAVSILFDGYVDKGKIVSLSGTLVPATKLNSIIASIPVVGDILVGKKTGEGVVGVSFKMKGPPKDIKTTVNPIKTLTPRFIVRALEKMKKKKNNETK